MRVLRTKPEFINRIKKAPSQRSNSNKNPIPGAVIGERVSHNAVEHPHVDKVEEL